VVRDDLEERAEATTYRPPLKSRGRETGGGSHCKNEELLEGGTFENRGTGKRKGKNSSFFKDDGTGRGRKVNAETKFGAIKRATSNARISYKIHWEGWDWADRHGLQGEV